MIYTFREKIETIDPVQLNRYMGMGKQKPDEILQKSIDEMQQIFLRKIEPKVCYTQLDIELPGDGTVVIEDRILESKSLEKNLSGCDSVILMAATIGAAQEQLKRSYMAKSPTAGLIMDALGTVAIEELCNDFCKYMSDTMADRKLRPRFSPGYGDLGLQHQDWLLKILDSHRKIGVALTSGNLMIPQKSVSAIIGVGKDGCEAKLHDCENCSLISCAYRLI